MKKINPNKKTIMLSFKVNAEEMRHILALALSKTEGNVSRAIRKALGLKK